MKFTFFVNWGHGFCDSDYEAKGVGGSESALILLSRELASRGHRVEIFSKNPQIGIFSGVLYRNLNSFDPTECFDVAILFRTTFLGFIAIQAAKKLFWSTDLDWADWDQWVFPFVASVLTMSEFHAKFLHDTYAGIRDKQTIILGLGVAKEEYAATPLKSENRLIYCSVPDRGLKFLPKLFREIQKSVPTATLEITSDYSLWGRQEGTSEFRSLFSGIPGVTYHGKISRTKLVELQLSSKLMVYPCTYHEGFCIAALECMASGAIPITTKDFALTTTVGDYGVLIAGKPGTEDYDHAFVKASVELLQDDEKRCVLAQLARGRALGEMSWDIIADRFVAHCICPKFCLTP